jgi:hypothetical protein
MGLIFPNQDVDTVWQRKSPNLFPIEERSKIVEEITNIMPIGTFN